MNTISQAAIREMTSETFPFRLKEISDPPEKLYIQGVLPPEDYKWLTVVGPRKYSSYGKEVTEMLVEGLSHFPVVIVSGLALGVDAIAHKAALRAKLPTVAVPGSGLNRAVLYPSANRRLADEILRTGGALLSEFEADFRATAWSFPQRNRILAGLSDAVLVIEAEQKSGALITSKFATEYNRDVFTVPGSVFSAASAGPHMLLKLGATPITSANDLLEALGFEAAKRSALNARRLDDCAPEEKKVIALLQNPMPRDELLDSLDMPIGRANALLSLMELKGFIKESGGEIRLL